MTTTSLNLSHKADLDWLARLSARVRMAAEGTPFFLTGAMVRDLLLFHGYGIDPGRETRDVDLAFMVEDWEAYNRIKSKLLASGDFTEDKTITHRLLFNNEVLVDLVPFGGVEREDRTIVWRPDGSTEMNVLGFKEALSATVSVVLPDTETVSVVSLPAFIILKLVAWSERRLTEPGKDAYDIALVMRKYLEAGNSERLYDEASQLFDEEDYDYEVAGTWLLGKDMAVLLAADGKRQLAAMLERESDSYGALRLVGDMPLDTPHAIRLLQGLYRGFIGS